MINDAVLNHPRISAVVPAYNVERYLAIAIDSLLDQSLPFHEIIIVDDGSTDGTRTIAEQYMRHPAVKIIHIIDNGGQGRARNVGLTQASGDYVYFFDADDVLENCFIASMQAVLRGRPEIDIVYFSGESFLDPGFSSDYLPAYRRNLEMEFASGIDSTGVLLLRGTCFATPCLYLSKRALWGEGRLAFMHIVHEDEEIITRLGCAAGVSVCVDTVFYRRRIRPESTMTLAKSSRNTDGYLHTLASLALQCRRDRKLLLPIQAQMVRRFYGLLGGYLTMCRKIGERPRYRLLINNLLTLGRIPSAYQLYEMSVLSKLYGWLYRLGKKFVKQPANNQV